MKDEKLYKFRENVAAVILNKEGRILTCERVDIAGAWQLPQGGIEIGETPEQAVAREVWEEVGITEFEMLARTPFWVRYEWPRHLWRDNFKGQEQIYFLLRVSDDSQISLVQSGFKPEFGRYRWLNFREFKSVVHGFKRNTYLRVIGEFVATNPSLIQLDD